MKKKGIFSTKQLVILALLSALSIVLTRFASIMLAGGTIRLGFGSIPIVLSGFLFGPLSGGIVGVLSDLLGVIMNPQGKFHLGFTLSSALTGIIPGLIVLFYKKKDIVSVFISNILIYLIVSLTLNTYWLTTLYGKGFFVLLPARAIGQGIITIISIFFIITIYKIFNQLKYLSE